MFWICLNSWLEIPFLSASVRHLAGEVAKEWQEVEENDKTQQETLLKLVKEIVPYNMAHNAEHEACDLLMEIERLDMLEDYIDENAYGKVCLYLTRFVQVHTFVGCIFMFCWVKKKKKNLKNKSDQNFNLLLLFFSAVWVMFLSQKTQRYLDVPWTSSGSLTVTQRPCVWPWCSMMWSL